MWSSAVITVNGELVPCCFDKDANYKMGNIKKTSFEKVWRSKEYNAFRNQIFLDRSQIEICKNCSEGTKVWA
jgi:radical SAM protein with 4Fe4S-binding SPASM domain